MYKSLTFILTENPEPSYQIQGYKTGYRSLDYVLDGIKESDLVLLMAKVNNLGCIFLENLAVGLSRQHHVLVINTEKNAMSVASELKSVLMTMVDADQDQVESSEELNLLAKNLFVADNVRFIKDIEKTIEAFKTEYPENSIVIIDNLHGLFLSKEVRTYSRQQEEFEISQNLKMLTLKHNVPIMVYSRIKSSDLALQDNPPCMADIAHLLGLHCHFDKILGIHRSENRMVGLDSDGGSSNNELQVYVLKNAGRKPDMVRFNLSDSNRYMIFEQML